MCVAVTNSAFKSLLTFLLILAHHITTTLTAGHSTPASHWSSLVTWLSAPLWLVDAGLRLAAIGRWCDQHVWSGMLWDLSPWPGWITTSSSSTLQWLKNICEETSTALLHWFLIFLVIPTNHQNHRINIFSSSSPSKTFHRINWLKMVLKKNLHLILRLFLSSLLHSLKDLKSLMWWCSRCVFRCHWCWVLRKGCMSVCGHGTVECTGTWDLTPHHASIDTVHTAHSLVMKIDLSTDSLDTIQLKHQ